MIFQGPFQALTFGDSTKTVPRKVPAQGLLLPRLVAVTPCSEDSSEDREVQSQENP